MFLGAGHDRNERRTWLVVGYGAAMRFFEPVPTHYAEATAIAVLGLGVNLLSAWLLGGEHHITIMDMTTVTPINTPTNIITTRAIARITTCAAYWHVLADAPELVQH